MTNSLEESMISRIELYLSERKMNEAAERADDLVTVGNKDPIAWYEKAKVLYLNDKFDDSIYCLKMGLDIDKTPAELWQLVGYNMLAVQKFSEAVEALEYVKTMQPRNAEAVAALALAYLYAGTLTRFEFNLKYAMDIDRIRAMKVIINFFERGVEKNPSIANEQRESARAAIQNLLGK